MTENAPNQTGKNYFLAFCQLLKSRAIFQEKDGFQKHFTSLTHLHWLLSILYQIPDYKNSSVLYPEHTGIALINASCCKWLFLRHITLECRFMIPKSDFEKQLSFRMQTEQNPDWPLAAAQTQKRLWSERGKKHHKYKRRSKILTCMSMCMRIY